MKKILILMAMLGLNGCYITQMGDNLRALNGYPISTAISILGLPDNVMNMQGMTVYMWGNTVNYSYTTTDLANTDGMFGMVPFHYMTSYDTHHSDVSTCKIKIATNPRGIIINSSFDGGALACDSYAYNLSRALGR